MRDENQLVSIIMPAYNVAPFIKQAVESVVAQSYPKWELLIVDDHSKDETRRIIESYQKKDSRIKLLNGSHQGPGASRNLGLDNARGEIFAFLDADDYFEPQTLQRGVAAIELGADCAVFDLVRFTKDNPQIETRRFGIDYYNAYTGSWNKIYRRSLWQGLRYPERVSIEDLRVVPLVMYRARKVVHLDGLYYHYRITEGSLTQTRDPEEAVQIVPAVTDLLEQLQKAGAPFDHHMAEFINKLVFPHLLRGIEGARSRAAKAYVYHTVAGFLRTVNQNDFSISSRYYDQNRLKRLRTQVVMTCFAMGMYALGAQLMELSWRVSGKLS